MAVIDTGVGNLGSVVKMLRYVDADPIVIRSEDDSHVLMASASHVVLPGVGAFDRGMDGLTASGLDNVVRGHVLAGRPLLGMCLGMQLLFEGSEEGRRAGLGLLPGRCVRISPTGRRKVPHMGWNWVDELDGPLKGADELERQRFYFTHSYRADGVDPRHIAGVTEYGDRFVSAVSTNSVLGVQFHPEKSHRFGVALFNRFVRWTP